jgi:hypothetical protein
MPKRITFFYVLSPILGTIAKALGASSAKPWTQAGWFHSATCCFDASGAATCAIRAGLDRVKVGEACEFVAGIRRVLE